MNKLKILLVGAQDSGKTSVAELLTTKKTVFNKNYITYDYKENYEIIEISNSKQINYLAENEKYALIIFVKRRGYLLWEEINSYNTIKFFSTKIPKICVITGCEIDDNPFNYYNERYSEFDKIGMLFNYGLSGCFAQEEKAKHLYATDIEISKKLLQCAIEIFALSENCSISQGGT